jgi:hypothetical protein
MANVILFLIVRPFDARHLPPLSLLPERYPSNVRGGVRGAFPRPLRCRLLRWLWTAPAQPDLPDPAGGLSASIPADKLTATGSVATGISPITRLSGRHRGRELLKAVSRPDHGWNASERCAQTLAGWPPPRRPPSEPPRSTLHASPDASPSRRLRNHLPARAVRCKSDI